MRATEPGRATASPANDESLDSLVDRFAHRVPAFARRVARRYGLASLWHDDLVSAGYWGLLKALKNRRPEAHDHELSAYVSTRIEGTILDEMRRLVGHVSSLAACDPSDLETAYDESSEEIASYRGQPAVSPEVEADRGVRWRAVERSLEPLDGMDRHLLFTIASGHSLAEIARAEGATPSRLQGRFQRTARRVRAQAPELRRILREEI